MNLEPTIRNAPKILVADDSLIIQKTVLMALKQEGYQVLVSRDISEILSTVRREKPDVILLDLSYPLDADYVGGPSQDGFFVIEWLRRTSGSEKVPIIIISAADPATYQNQVQAYGIAACFRKPLNRVELLTAIQVALHPNHEASSTNTAATNSPP